MNYYKRLIEDYEKAAGYWCDIGLIKCGNIGEK